MQVTKQSKQVMEAVVKFWFPSHFQGKGVVVLSALLKWMSFAFMPVELGWADQRQEKVDLETITLSPIEDEATFSLNKSFNELHYLACKAPAFSSISNFFDQVYSPFRKPDSTSSFPKDAKWFSSTKLYSS